jgi:indolepyruvate ferredoxin oxidoreductase alpha subunit
MSEQKSSDNYFLSGNEALARGAWEAGLHFASAYPGTPSTEILEALGQYAEVDAQWAANEKTAYEVAYGAAIGGARALFACKHVGLNVAMDPFMISAYTGINGGLVAVVADDPGMHSSQNEQDTRRLALFAKIPLLEPSSPAQCYEFARAAFDLSERFDTPVLIRTTTRIAHTKESFAVSRREDVQRRPFVVDPRKYVMIPGHARGRHAVLEQRLVALKEYAENCVFNKVTEGDNSIGFIVDSVSALYVREMYPEASVLTLGMPYPFPEAIVRKFASRVKELYVVEELEPFLEEQLKLLGISVKAKKASFVQGELRPEHIPQIVAGREREDVNRPGRRPVLCPGCPHRATFTVLKKNKCTVAGDIGCYTLGALDPLAALHTQTCMGASIPFMEGIRKSVAGNVVAVIGDSTFVHTGIPGLISAVYNQAKGVVLILDNATTAMTGTQPNPATGVTLKGEQTRRLSLEELTKACAVDSVDTVDPLVPGELDSVLKQRLSEDSLAVIIVRSPCRLVEKSRKPPVSIDSQECRQCGICLSIGCPAISKNEDGGIEIDQALCVGCGLCVSVCPFKAIKK